VLPEVKFLADAASLPLPEMSSWIGLVAPAGTPPAIVEKLYREVVKAYADPVVADRLEKAGIMAVTTTPQEFDQFFRAEAARWTELYKQSGIKLE
jgi:tripartite-type tricarboxylate transporter receptor subunit TctC